MKAWVWEDEYKTDMGVQFDISSEGFRLRGWEVERYTEIDQVDLQDGDVLHGVASDIHTLGISQVPDYPSDLEDFVVSHRTMNLDEAKGLEHPFFIKPVSHKEFTGFVASRPASLGCIEGNPEVWVADVVEFLSEWRVYVLHGEVVKVCHYKGHPLEFPRRDRIQSMIYAWEDAPAAYALDVGVISSGGGWELDTMLVEVNDVFCLGNYGVDPCEFVPMLEARWKQVWESDFTVSTQEKGSSQ